MRQPAALALALSLAIPGLAAGDGSSAMTPPRQQLPTATPEQEAVGYYNDGISARDKAVAYEKEAAAEADTGKKQKLEARAKDKHEASIKKFLAATRKDPRMFQAWGSLGYAYRVTGNYTASLEAYAKALEIQPAYTLAIEYRAEAYLGLGRLDEVKSAYMTLFNTDRKRADELTSAIDRWLEKKKSDPAGIDPAKLDEFGKWASERKQLAAQTSSLTSGQELRW
ncbi:MAG: tetratricopeptide repeat protein [Thermoanaerobaculia bacterium]|nr:tetratricopeptide repeat protein [Thermoanaerobaculia bacterium]